MNLLEAFKAYNEGKKIRHKDWPEGNYCSKTKYLETSLGLYDDKRLSGGFFGKWLAEHAEGWEIRVKKSTFAEMRFGQIFKDGGCTYMKIMPVDDYNVVSMVNFGMMKLRMDSYKFELVEENK